MKKKTHRIKKKETTDWPPTVDSHSRGGTRIGGVDFCLFSTPPGNAAVTEPNRSGRGPWPTSVGAASKSESSRTRKVAKAATWKQKKLAGDPQGPDAGKSTMAEQNEKRLLLALHSVGTASAAQRNTTRRPSFEPSVLQSTRYRRTESFCEFEARAARTSRQS